MLVDHRREGWGLALKLSLAWERSVPRPWSYEGPATVAAFVWPLTEQRIHLHANLGVSRKQSAANTRAVWGLGADMPVARSLALFVEAGGRAGEDRLVHGGLRWWLRRDRVAFDTALSRIRERVTGEAHGGVHFGLNFYDLSP